MAKSKLSAIEKEKWATEFTIHSTLYYTGLMLTEWALMNMGDNPTATHGIKYTVGKERKRFKMYLKQVEKSAKSLGLTDSYKSQDDAVTDKVGAIGSIAYMIHQMPDEQIDYFIDAVEKIGLIGIDNHYEEMVKEGKLQKHLWDLNGECCEFFHDSHKPIVHVLRDAIAEVGEKITMRQFIDFDKKRKSFCL